MLYQKRLIQIFKNFVQKVLIPQIKKNDGSITQWNKFSTMLTAQTINYSDLQFFVDSLPPIQSLDRKQGTGLFLKKKQESNGQLNPDNLSVGFNPSKTFGGQRNKIGIFPIKTDFDDFNQQGSKKQSNNNRDLSPLTKQDAYKKNITSNGQNIMPSLERLYKNMIENQQKIQSIANGSNGHISYSQEYKNFY